MVLPIYLYGQKVLRKRATEVAKVTPELAKLADDMLETMYKSNGIGLAAPQIGRSIRLIVVDVAGEDEEKRPCFLFNPVVTERKGGCVAEEGCLSVPGVWADVERPEVITVEALDKDGKRQVLKDIGGLLARCIQHEIDHLDGVLFVDKISATDRTLNEGKLKKISKDAKTVPA
jgi:peptide deformylase